MMQQRHQQQLSDKQIIVYVSSCQNNEKIRFTTYVRPNATLSDIQRFLLDQWSIANHPFKKYPMTEQTFTYNGKLLRMNAHIDLYEISFQDEIWVRFSSQGPVTEPLAMSADELRNELTARNAYKKNLTPESLMQRLQDEIWKETRLDRLGAAMKRGDEALVKRIKNELVVMEKQRRKKKSKTKTAVTRPTSIAWPLPPKTSRFFFLSITELENAYQDIPRDVLESCVLIFDADRSWVFTTQNALQRQQFGSRYMKFPPDFLEFLKLKEEARLLFWFRPEKSFSKLSGFLSAITDPVSQKPYESIELISKRWLYLGGTDGWEGTPHLKINRNLKLKATTPKFTSSIQRIVTNLESGSFDNIAVQEMLIQANPNILFPPTIK